MDVPAVISSFAPFVALLAIVAVIVWGGVQARRELNETIRRAIDSGQQLDPKVISSIARPAGAAENDLRAGVLFACLAIGFALCGLLFQYAPIEHRDADFVIGFYAIAIIVGALGVGRLISSFLRRDRKAP